jgi:chromosome segregation ATPase
MHEIREGKRSADARESHLRATTDSLLNQLKTLQSQAVQAQKPSRPLDERDMIGTWRLKYTNISQALARSEELVNARETEIRQGEENVRTLTVQLDAARAEQHAAVQALDEANDRVCAHASEICELQQKVRAFRTKKKFWEWRSDIVRLDVKYRLPVPVLLLPSCVAF